MQINNKVIDLRADGNIIIIIMVNEDCHEASNRDVRLWCRYLQNIQLIAFVYQFFSYKHY